MGDSDGTSPVGLRQSPHFFNELVSGGEGEINILFQKNMPKVQTADCKFIRSFLFF